MYRILFEIMELLTAQWSVSFPYMYVGEVIVPSFPLNITMYTCTQFVGSCVWLDVLRCNVAY